MIYWRGRRKMAWEQLYNAFPTGAGEFDDIGFITIQDLQENPEIEAVSRTTCKMARDMTTEWNKEVFGPNGEYAIINQYDVYGFMEHPDPYVRPLNVYGMQMINDYIFFHDIDFDRINLDILSASEE